jgi:O-antigen ligase
MNIFNLVYSLIIIIISGSRSGVLIGGLSFVASIILGIRRSKKVIMTYTISLILSILISLIMVTTNWYSAGDMFFRATTLNTLTKTVSSLNMDITIEEASNKIVNISKQIESNNTDNNSDGQEQILIYNDLSRILLWKNALSEIKKSPIMGTGVISFKVSDDYYPSQSAHNFILEYALTFGGMGLLIWIVFFLNLIIGSYKMVRGEKKRPFLWLLISILFICGYSLLQPTLSMPAVTSITWLIVGVLWKFCDSSIVNED